MRIQQGVLTHYVMWVKHEQHGKMQDALSVQYVGRMDGGTGAIDVWSLIADGTVFTACESMGLVLIS